MRPAGRANLLRGAGGGRSWTFRRDVRNHVAGGRCQRGRRGKPTVFPWPGCLPPTRVLRIACARCFKHGRQRPSAGQRGKGFPAATESHVKGRAIRSSFKTAGAGVRRLALPSLLAVAQRSVHGEEGVLRGGAGTQHAGQEERSQSGAAKAGRSLHGQCRCGDLGNPTGGDATYPGAPAHGRRAAAGARQLATSLPVRHPPLGWFRADRAQWLLTCSSLSTLPSGPRPAPAGFTRSRAGSRHGQTRSPTASAA